MNRFSEKLKKARRDAGLSQAELADRIGVTPRSLTDYECGRAVPRRAKIERMADELGVTVLYLTEDSIDDPQMGLDADRQIRRAEQAYGPSAADEMQDLLRRNTAFLAGGEVPQEAKDRFFYALMSAYVKCKSTAARAEAAGTEDRPF